MAAVEAARLSGWDKIRQSVSVLHANWTVVHTQNLIDNAKDDDSNGVPDVNELSRKELFTRKWKLLLRTLDPEQVTEALHGLVVVFFSIVATLRVQFAQTITLGVALSETVRIACAVVRCVFTGRRCIRPLRSTSCPSSARASTPSVRCCLFMCC